MQVSPVAAATRVDATPSRSPSTPPTPGDTLNGVVVQWSDGRLGGTTREINVQRTRTHGDHVGVERSDIVKGEPFTLGGTTIPGSELDARKAAVYLASPDMRSAIADALFAAAQASPMRTLGTDASSISDAQRQHLDAWPRSNEIVIRASWGAPADVGDPDATARSYVTILDQTKPLGDFAPLIAAAQHASDQVSSGPAIWTAESDT